MNGAFIIDKPAGMTSHDVVSRVRRIAGTRRVGHAGTLDPFATGVLVVCINRATRLMQFLVGLDKQYNATIRLGFATDTQDATGKQITPLRASNELSLEVLRAVLGEFIGPQLQVPPMFSAKKVAGERLHRAARAGREVERKPVGINIYSIDLIEPDEEPLKANEDGTCDFIVRVRCSSGTYIRTLAHDIGEKLKTGAHLARLRRTAVGHFRIEDALTLELLEKAARASELRDVMISPADALAHLPLVRLNGKDADRILNGREVFLLETDVRKVEDARVGVRLCDEAETLIAVGEYDSASRSVRPRVVLGAGE